MSTRATLLTLAFLAGCATAAHEPAPDAGATTTHQAAPYPVETTRPAVSAGPSDWALAIVGTPFVFAFRVVTCAATAVVAAPTAGWLLLTPDPQPGMAYLRDSLGQNCGPPYVVGVPVAAGYTTAPEVGYTPPPDVVAPPLPDVGAPQPDGGRPRTLTPYSSAAVTTP
jgi:hypothetical protein